MKKRAVLREERRRDLDRVLADVVQRIGRIRDAAPRRVGYLHTPIWLREAVAARYAARALADDAERYVAELARLPPHLAETLEAARSVARALESAEAELAASEPWLIESWRLLGVAAMQVGAAVGAADQRALAAQYGSVGGRPSKAGRDAALAARFDELQRIRRNVTRRELYEDVADEAGVGWATVRDAVLAMKKAPPAG